MILLKYLIRSIIWVLYKGGLGKFIWIQKKIRKNKNLLIQINSGIGDSVLALPLINVLSTKGYTVHAIVNNHTKAVAALCTQIKKYYRVDYRLRMLPSFFRQVRDMDKMKFKYFIGALPSNVIRDAFLPIILKIPVRIKHHSPHKEYLRNYDFLFNNLLSVNGEMNNADSNLRLLSLLSESLEDNKEKFNMTLSEEIVKSFKSKFFKQGFSEDKITVGIHPGCKVTWAFKRWPAENFINLINRLYDNINLQITIFGGPDELSLADKIMKETKVKPMNMIGKLGLEETIVAISFCNLFISNDSGLMHVATLFDIPVIGLFGNKSNEIATGPYGNLHVVIKKSDVKDITVNEVYNKTLSLISDRIYNKTKDKVIPFNN